MIDTRIADLRARDLNTLVPPLESLRAVLGDVELTRSTERTLTWLLGWDHAVILGLTALISDARNTPRRAP